MAILATLLLLAAVCVVLLNWGCVIASLRWRRRGIDRRVSAVPFFAQILALAGAIAAYNAQASLLPSWLFWAVALADVPVVALSYYPIFRLRRRLAGRP
jgi:hypothetical protein